MQKTWLPEVKDEETRRALAVAVLALFASWQLHEVNQAALLGMRDVSCLRAGEPLPEDAAVLERAGHLLAIGRALRKAFPNQLSRRTQWVSSPHEKLFGATPLQYMLAGDVETISQIRALAEHTPYKNVDK
jgi:hypothetical protein